ncbi:Receptor-type guanylate cyclase gcy [Seminavis robusta]|uniref:Receptor-type guanylate cyclase gcy n=1 Tax=Seminavis robusta TaxID=568900 RepID=A0A9N8H6X2_9STRA|nr:Receptor-type guanylate cyclase gcy [Seminavis robusta]|eukprot:Sro55_g032260.1 Receptor-type guanylate cyclase gcy (1466) ;mRNA; f:45265-51649
MMIRTSAAGGRAALVPWLLMLLLMPTHTDASKVPCSVENDVCSEMLREGSYCVDGYCTNPFYAGGCLQSYGYNLSNNEKRIRVCHSEDPLEAEELGFCRPATLDYIEIRLASQNWESVFFEAWILQILLTEILEVPVTVETGVPGYSVDFYHMHSALDYGVFDEEYHELQVAADVKDCRLTKTDDPDNYQACFHASTEVWWDDRGFDAHPPASSEPPRELGALGQNSWFVPKFTAQNDTSLLSYIGLQGPQNRRKLAETFKRPTNFRDYCEQVSERQCQDDNATSSIATRPPLDDTEGDMFFVEGVYTGHFRYTEENDCDKHPTNCTGHFTNYPCVWESYAEPQIYHHQMGFEHNMYTYAQMTQIWSAANATKENVISIWWRPQIMYESYLGTDTEMTQVVLTPPTQECSDNRINTNKRCDEDRDLFDIVGNPVGACDSYSHTLQKVFSTALKEVSFDKNTPEEFWSPAYDVLLNFKLSSLQIGQIFQYWANKTTDKANFDFRDATCEWVIDHMDLIQRFIPDTYPRAVVYENDSGSAMHVSALVIACLTSLLVIASIGATHLKRQTKIMYYTQPEYLYTILVGFFLIALSAIILAIPPSDPTCVVQQWLSNLGHIVAFFPLVARISAINQLATSGKQMQRVRLHMSTLGKYMGVAVCLVMAYTLVWSLVDAPGKAYTYQLSGDKNDNGATLISGFDYCGSDSEVWPIINFGWQALLLIPGCMIAFLASRVREDLNDTKSMVAVLNTNLGFLVLNVAFFFLVADSKRSELMAYASLILSANVVASLGVYFVPKFLDSGENFEADPLPDVFVKTTVALLDVHGFAAWSSCREPVQVFKFLEKLFESIDNIAAERQVFKVETKGEVYVAASGIPDARNDHAIAMARFALSCMKKMEHLFMKLEVIFGPDTGDMSLRIAMHSGPVTGGFLKGKGAQRFQLFGDTMTTAGLIQAAGQASRVHMSEATAKLLIKAGKRKWVVKRMEKLQTEEKGELQTYWLARGGRAASLLASSGAADLSSQGLGTSSGDSEESDLADVLGLDSQQRWIEWNLELFKDQLKQIVARRESTVRSSSELFSGSDDLDIEADMPLEEVKEIIELPGFDKKAAKRQLENKEVTLSPLVVEQLRELITRIANEYNDNPFHNFAHASYVVMAVQKYMNRIVAASEVDVGEDEERHRSSTMAAIHDHTYGITSDPLTQFACLFSALIHDVDHPGVPNGQLIKEDERIASRYKNRSVAEQKSLDISWLILMESDFDELRSTVCHNSRELRRFRELVVNSVMATDLGDAELKALRNARWEKAFATMDISTTHTGRESFSNNDEENPRPVRKSREATNRKATIVIEHLIQAADVAHMSQHWHIYRKWNERLFREMYKAFREDRSDTNPADFWYKGELGFIDYYVVPLSKKLRDCGVFGPTSDENLNYATNNRSMWEKEGEDIVAKMLETVEAEYAGGEKMEQPATFEESS